MQSDILVDAGLLDEARKTVFPITLSKASARLKEVEPVLCAEIERIAGQAIVQLEHDLNGDVDAVARANVYEAVHRSALIAAEGLRRGFFALWRETVIGSRLAQLDPSLTSGAR